MRVHGNASEADVKKALKKFTGKIKQLPPKISAVKRVEREREVYYIDYLGKQRNTVELIIGCQAGTYIRKLCHDIGEHLGTGAHMAKLIRTKAGPFKLKDSTGLDEIARLYKEYMKTKDEKLIRKIILPVEKAVEHLPKVWIDDLVLPRLKNGSPVFAPGILQVEDDIKAGDLVACMTTENKLASVGYAEMDSQQMVRQGKGLAVKTDVVMI